MPVYVGVHNYPKFQTKRLFLGTNQIKNKTYQENCTNISKYLLVQKYELFKALKYFSFKILIWVVGKILFFWRKFIFKLGKENSSLREKTLHSKDKKHICQVLEISSKTIQYSWFLFCHPRPLSSMLRWVAGFFFQIWFILRKLFQIIFNKRHYPDHSPA